MRKFDQKEFMNVAVAIVNYRTPRLVLSCLRSLLAERIALPQLHVIVVDNASGDDSADLLSAAIAQTPFADWVRFMPQSLNGGFGWGNNQALLTLLNDASPPDAILLLNPDTVIEPGAIAALVEDMKRRPDAGAIGSQLVNEDGSLSGSAFRFPSVAREFDRGFGMGRVSQFLGIQPTLIPIGERGPMDWVTGASVLIRSEALRQVGLFDTGFFLYFEEVELMHRLAQAGWKCYHCPESRVVHVAGASTGVVDGKSEARRVPPDYLFVSRHRYFALTGGKLRAWLADIAWLLGGFLRVRGRQEISEERAAFLKVGLGASALDEERAITKVGDPIGEAPFWMSAR
jgi:N-acetylglucosaminyl-diphospho-decaprenol L-rhamnosyltransferase